MDASDDLIATGTFVECVFSCPDCGASGTSMVRPVAVIGKTCVLCGAELLLSVLGRFAPTNVNPAG